MLIMKNEGCLLRSGEGHWVLTDKSVKKFKSFLLTVPKLSFNHMLTILLRDLSVHTLFQNCRFNKDVQKNKQEYINKPMRTACKDIFFINNAYIWIE